MIFRTMKVLKYKMYSIMVPIAVVFSLLVIGITSYAENTFEVTSDKTNLNNGDTAAIEIYFPGGNLYNGAEVNVVYDTAVLEYKGTETSTIYNNAFINDLKENEGSVLITTLSVSNYAEGGILGKVLFQAITDSEINTDINISIKASNTDFVNEKINKTISIRLNGNSSVPTTVPAPTRKPSSSGGGGSYSGNEYTATQKPEVSPSEKKEENLDFTPILTQKPDNEIAISYIDIDNHWANTEISALSKMGLVNGFADNTFRPDENVTRAQFAKMIIEAKNINSITYAPVFKDVNENDWFSGYASAAYEAGFAKGDDNGNFNPELNITRQEMAVMAVRAFGIIKEGECDFSDKSDIAQWAETAVASASNSGIITGRDNNLFMPQNNATRAEAAVIMYRLINLSADVSDSKEADFIS